MSKNTHRIFYKEDGSPFTVAKANEGKFLDMGYTLGPESKGGARWDIDEAIRNDRPGSDWVDDGRNTGSIIMKKPGQDPNSKGIVGVNARYADKYFDKGYYLDSRSQSVNRALTADRFKQEDAANAAIRSGTYSTSGDYYKDDYVSGGYYDRDVKNGLIPNNSYLDSVNRALGNLSNNHQNLSNQMQQENLELKTQLENLLNQYNADTTPETLDRLLQEFNQFRSSYSANENNYTSNNQINNTGSSANYSTTSLGNQILPGQIFIGNSGKKTINQNGVNREMSDDEVVKYLDSIYGF